MAHEVAGVLTVEDAEPRGVAHLLCVASEDPVAGRVEGAAVDPAGVAIEQATDPIEHLPGRLVGEGQQEDLPGWDAVFDEPAGAVDQGAGLAGPGAGEDQHGAARVHDRGVVVVR